MIIKVKEFLVASPLAGPLQKLSSGVKRRVRTISHPELDQFYRDDDYLDRVLAALVARSSNCIDIGCHIGSVLKRFTELAPDGVHMAVEPTPAKAASLRQHFPGVTIHQCALADAPGEAVFYEDLKRPGYSSLATKDGGAPEIHAYTVRLQTLDEIAAKCSAICLIKIDVEGAELQVLSGGAQVIAKHRPAIIFECGPVASESDDGFSGDDLYAHLCEQLDYEIFAAIDLVFGRPALTLPEFRRYRTYPFTALNFIALPKGFPALKVS